MSLISKNQTIAILEKGAGTNQKKTIAKNILIKMTFGKNKIITSKVNIAMEGMPWTRILKEEQGKIEIFNGKREDERIIAYNLQYLNNLG
jgi:hypothetical protein